MLRRLAPYSALLWTGLFLLTLELGLEFRAAGRGYHPLLLSLVEGTQGSADSDQAPARFGPTEDFPYRSEVIAPKDARAQTTIWLASSSYGEDTHQPIEKLFATHLAKRFGKPLINASYHGKVITSNLADLQAAAADFEPDIALLYQMSNDIDQIAALITAPSDSDSEQAPAESSNNTAFAPASPWVEQMTLYHHIKGQLASRLAQHLPLWDSLVGREAAGNPTANETFKARIEEFVDGSLALGAKPVLVTFATAYTAQTIDTMPGFIERQNLVTNTLLSSRGWIDSVDEFNRVMREVAADRGVTCIDLAASMSGQHELFRDLWHFTAEGHKAVADHLGAALEEKFPELSR